MGGALAAVPLVAYLHPVGLIVANYTITVVKRSRNCWGGVKCFWGAGTGVGRSRGLHPLNFPPRSLVWGFGLAGSLGLTPLALPGGVQGPRGLMWPQTGETDPVHPLGWGGAGRAAPGTPEPGVHGGAGPWLGSSTRWG